jgi:hypothetical protein
MPAGYKLSPANESALWPEQMTEAEGLNLLRNALGKLQSATTVAPSPLMGKLTVDEFKKLTCRHSELHLSFVTLAKM